MSLETLELKVVLVGNSNVGKTCIVQMGVNNEFSKDSIPTLGAAYSSKVINIGQTTVNLQIWDTAGQEKYRGMTPMYYRGGKVALACYAIDDKASFKALDSWVDDLKQNADPSVIIFIVGNKCDLDNNREVPAEDALALANSLDGNFYEVSAKTGQNIDNLFIDIAKVYINKLDKKPLPNEMHVELNEGGAKKSCC